MFVPLPLSLPLLPPPSLASQVQKEVDEALKAQQKLEELTVDAPA